jgi:hypothetical protein
LESWSKEGQVIANLMSSGAAVSAFAALDVERRQRFERRLSTAHRLWAIHPELALESRFSDDLEELQTAASGIVLEALLDRIEMARNDVLRERSRDSGPADRSGRDLKPRGRFLFHRFADSLGTGEAEIAARGFFDVWDRPPISLWLEAFSRPMPRREGVFEVCVLAFVPQDCVARATAGRDSCSSGALFFYDEAECDLQVQLAAMLGGDSGA